jgi:hypothetical protein
MQPSPTTFGLASTLADPVRLAEDLVGILPHGAPGYYLQILKGPDQPFAADALEARLKERCSGAPVVVDLVPTALLQRCTGGPVLVVTGLVLPEAEVARLRRERAEAAPALPAAEDAGATDLFASGGTLPGAADRETRRLCWQARNAKGAVLGGGEWDLPRQGLRFGVALGKAPRPGMVAIDGPGSDLVAHDGRRREWGFSRDQFQVDWERLSVNGRAPTHLLFDPGQGEGGERPLRQGEQQAVAPRSIWTVATNPDLVRLRTHPRGMAPEDAAVAELRFVLLAVIR